MLQDFFRIGPRAHLFTPEGEKCQDGHLVIICTWLGAAHKHIAKYTALYRDIAPRTRILLIESDVQILVSSYAHQRRQIQKPVSVVLDIIAECKSLENAIATSESKDSGDSPKIILHAFSNGGINAATQLLIELRKRNNGPIPLASIVLDSGPAKGTYWRSYNAMVLSLPPDVISQIFGAIAVHFLLVLLYTWIACGNENPASLMRRTLLDEETLHLTPNASNGHSDNSHLAANNKTDTFSQPTQILYLYSKADRMVDWTDIRDHAIDARSRGWQVSEVVFDGSAHCAHMSRFESRYTAAIRAMYVGSGQSELVQEEQEGTVRAKL